MNFRTMITGEYLPVCELGCPPSPRLAICQYAPKHALDVKGWTRCAGQDDVAQLFLQVARHNIRPLNAVLRRIVCRLMAKTGHLICAKDTEEPDCPRDRDGVGMEQVEQVLTLRAVRNALPELV